ncbi:hypothetical protein CYMTET_30316 [Cymbomonas tetramitiformis]|uniref:F-box domain-containing protein n=1 Tax=Cymbomonas tetramitiformis TaxID=36881 RepID=A0AAE0FJD4_9CHLO|nr:hypothetical protein CYMTET_30316 [Cymbomonas tetramitiformis]
MACTPEIWDQLPADCWERILLQAGLRSICASAQVCRSWHRAATAEPLWKSLCAEQGLPVDRKHRTWLAFYRHQHISVRNWREGISVYTPWPSQHGGAWITGVAMDETHVVSGSYDRTVIVWDRLNGQWNRILRGHTGQVTCVALCGRHVVSGSRDRTARLWDIPSERQIACISNEPPQDYVNSVALNPKLLSGSVDRTAQLWDVEEGTLQKKFGAPHDDGVTAVAISGDLVVTGDLQGILRVWEASTGQLLRTLEGHSDWIRSVAINPNGILCSAGRDAKLIIWNLTRTYQGNIELDARGLEMRSVAMDESGIVAGGKDGIMHSWQFSPNEDAGRNFGYHGHFHYNM